MTDAPDSRVVEDKTGEPIDIVPYRPADLQDTLDMYRNYPEEHRSHGLPPVLDDKLLEWLRSLERNGRAFIARHDDKVVAHAAYTPVTADKPDFVVFVDPEYQNRGIGTAMLYHVVRHTAAEGFDAIESYVDRDNESGIHVYEKCGFEEVERDPLIVNMRLDLSGFTVDDQFLEPD